MQQIPASHTVAEPSGTSQDAQHTFGSFTHQFKQMGLRKASLRRDRSFLDEAVMSVVQCWAIVASAILAQANPGPSVVRVEKTDQGWRMTRNGEPYVIKGVGGHQSLDRLAACGANSIRTWSADSLPSVLDAAHQQGLTVTVGLWLGHERHGFDYTNSDQVAAQAEAVESVIRQYKDHPAVLMWALGNEMEGYESGDNAAIWSAINNLATRVKRLDPQHPTMTVIAEMGGNRIRNIHRLCPDIDVIGINSYGGAATLPERYRAAKGIKPYVVTEFGPAGSWEVRKNGWGVGLEPSSTEKTRAYQATYAANVTQNASQCLGSYAFLWGHKQEATATWFGLLLPDGSRLAGVDALQELWSGKGPENRCPAIESLRIEGPDRGRPGTRVTARLSARDPEQDPLQIQWILQAEPLEYSVGGDAEAVPPVFPEALREASATGVTVELPEGGGGYRLFAYVRDGHGGAAVANVPLFVEGPVKVPEAKVARLPLVVYGDGQDQPPYVPTGWMGNTKAMKLDEACGIEPRSGKTCLQFRYQASEGWGGIVWQSPPQDWGDKPGGWNLQGARRLTFWARGETGNETATFQFGILGEGKRFRDTGRGELKDVKLSTQWQQYEIPLSGQSLDRIKTGFVITVASPGTPLTIYVDDVSYQE